jgi:hypothetical protein
MLPLRIRGYESMDNLKPCPACGSLRWWFGREDCDDRSRPSRPPAVVATQEVIQLSDGAQSFSGVLERPVAAPFHYESQAETH